MIAGLRHLLRAPEPSPAEETDAVVEPAPVLREEEFTGYGADCRIFGFIKIGEERLTDALNAREEYRLESVLLASLEDGRTVEAKELDVRRNELFAVRAAGPRGNPLRRIRTRLAPVVVKAGPYTFHGYLHVPPGGSPVTNFRRRRPMVPLTGAWIEYRSGGAEHRARVGAVLVNRELADWIDSAKDAEVNIDLPLEIRMDPRAKDMTGYIHVGEEAELSA